MYMIAGYQVVPGMTPRPYIRKIQSADLTASRFTTYTSACPRVQASSRCLIENVEL